MSKSEQEIEVKFRVHNHDKIIRQLKSLHAVETAGRVLETNLRFDTPGSDLTHESRVLRLRKDFNSVMTYKGPMQPGQEVSSRQEIEFEVSDFTAAQHLLEALGYQIMIIYEKYRTTYEFEGMTIVLDEMPYGTFIEIEGPNAASIRKMAEALQLDWEARSTASYLALFNQLRAARGLAARNLTFEELAGIKTAPQDLGLRFAD